MCVVYLYTFYVNTALFFLCWSFYALIRCIVQKKTKWNNNNGNYTLCAHTHTHRHNINKRIALRAERQREKWNNSHCILQWKMCQHDHIIFHCKTRVCILFIIFFFISTHSFRICLGHFQYDENFCIDCNMNVNCVVFFSLLNRFLKSMF